jgi:hypothetical protein
VFSVDEHPRPDATLEGEFFARLLRALQRARPSTASNAHVDCRRRQAARPVPKGWLRHCWYACHTLAHTYACHTFADSYVCHALSHFIRDFNRLPISVHFCSCLDVQIECVATIMNTPPGNASGISDGAGAIVLASESAASKHNLKPIARVLGYHISGKNAFSVQFMCRAVSAVLPSLPPAVIHFARCRRRPHYHGIRSRSRHQGSSQELRPHDRPGALPLPPSPTRVCGLHAPPT